MPTFADTGSDSHNRKNAPLGYRRTYIYLGDQPLSPASIVRALREGRSFLSRGALLDVTIGGERPGGSVTATQLPVRVAVESALPMERIDIVHNGKVVHSWAAGGKREFAGARSLPAADGWYLAQVRESKNPVPLAMSNPVFVRKKQGKETK